MGAGATGEGAEVAKVGVNDAGVVLAMTGARPSSASLNASASALGNS